MTITRSQRKRLENKPKENSQSTKTPTQRQESNTKKQTVIEKQEPAMIENEKNVVDQQKETKDEQEVIDRQEEESDSSESESSDSDSSDLSSDEESEDLDSLLNKAEAALVSNQDDLSLEKKPTLQKLSKLNTGLDSSLYFKAANGRVSLASEAVQLVEPGQKPTQDSPLVVQANNTLEKQSSRKERQIEREKTTGKDWFDMPRPEITPELKRDLQILKMRHVLDRKRHYKKMGKQEDPKYFQVGTIIQGPTEFFSARMTNKERKQTIVDELLASDEQKQYYKRKHNEVSTRSNRGGKRDYKKLKAQRKMKF
ncbi:hypothetical protein G6F46_009905 [Rhizopus delemar]|uniref:Fcf2 pre-rRNA processing C-terminal domain-containing protein n=3 Tax=Rhizopus TaxID=4842 RepID=I1BH39_RHIO9|nr:hypothetical protein RO3G_00223 [Rhizopus delemar RA 99-880]KAG1449560.1 hypothetical protein G6F55_010112 [Rhizopus delemar]KAG1536607.1 hypothetical protein G6F51_010876 [Rhizopus arrhizus]KAG1490968.1 hypothetical protein G6F54_010349 [Rhizopus delemar]KAG1509722.1 hypothetical protein G6F53_007221 [Rhizopus delemar]|eukprot:EIE75519.1 hypothetical protein RO3G_00223 [Rhizopus delemar RA 99-880]